MVWYITKRLMAPKARPKAQWLTKYLQYMANTSMIWNIHNKAGGFMVCSLKKIASKVYKMQNQDDGSILYYSFKVQGVVCEKQKWWLIKMQKLPLHFTLNQVSEYEYTWTSFSLPLMFTRRAKFFGFFCQKIGFIGKLLLRKMWRCGI